MKIAKKRKILLVHNNKEMIEDFSNLIENNGSYSLALVIHDGNQLINLKTLDDFDIVIVKDALMHLNGLYALESLIKNTNNRPDLIILLSPFKTSFIVNKCEYLGMVLKNDSKVSANQIIDLIYKNDHSRVVKNKLFFDPQFEIIRLLKEIGLLKRYKGYSYFEYGLNFMFERSENLKKSMISLYESIGHHFNVNAKSVEKAMRVCLKKSILINDNYYARTLFGYNINDENLPSNSLFFQICIQQLKDQKASIINNNIQKSIRKI
jgi:CheY-like chemotaxis protein